MEDEQHPLNKHSINEPEPPTLFDFIPLFEANSIFTYKVLNHLLFQCLLTSFDETN